MKFKAGEWVEVRSKEEILRTLDRNGELDRLPFMPEMFAWCGQRLRVGKRAHKTCDTVRGDYQGRKMKDAVLLEGIRCAGGFHGGCEAACSIFWKNDWLRHPSEAAPVRVGHEPGAVLAEADVVSAAKPPELANGGEPVYVCQATRLPAATAPLSAFDVRQYLEDYTSGNVGLGRIACAFVYTVMQRLITLGVGLGSPLRWLYDRFQRIRGGIPYPRRKGAIPIGGQTPVIRLGLQPGEWVRVKSYPEILRTLNQNNINRGMRWDAEMVPYCGGTYRVRQRVLKLIDEKTGKMVALKTPGLILEGVVCQARYSACRLFCPRAIYTYWRECWLERVGPELPDPGSAKNKT